jgi:SAM-dependent methyltransferase
MIKRVGRYLQVIKLVRLLLKADMVLEDKDSVFLHDFRHFNLKNGIVREEFIAHLVANKRLLHFGFLDSPFSKERIDSKQLLHLQLEKVVNYLYGIDIDEKSLGLYRDITNDQNNDLWDVQSQDELPDILNQNFDFILLGEVLEHLPNPYIALQNLYKICKLNSGKLIISVPNAFSLLAFNAASQGYELVHPDHYYFFSPFTLTRLLKDIGFTNISLHLVAPSHLALPGLTKHGLLAICES